MGIDRERVWEAGQRFLQRGQPDKAIVEFERIAAEDPLDLRVALKIGDLEMQRGNLEAARRYFLRVANAYLTEGFWSKAGAVLKQLAQAGPKDVEVQRLLAEVYANQGLHAEANSQWILLAELLLAAGNEKDAAASFDAIGELEGSDVTTILAWAALAERLGRTDAAKRSLGQLAESLREHDNTDGWALVATRLLELDNHLSGVASQLARYHLQAGEAAKALSCLRLVFKAAPQDPDTTQLLAETFEALGQVDRAASVYAELAEQARRRGQLRTLERMLSQRLRLLPDDQAAKAELASLQAAADGPKVRRGVRRSEASAPPPLSSGDLAALLIEAKVYRRYGLLARARQHLARVLAAQPGHEEALSLDRTYRSEQDDRRRQRAGHRVAQSGRVDAASGPLGEQAVNEAPHPAPAALLDDPTVAAPSSLFAEAEPTAPVSGTSKTLVRLGSRAAPVAEDHSGAEEAVFDLDLSGPEAAAESKDPFDIDSLDALIAASEAATEGPDPVGQALHAVAETSKVARGTPAPSQAADAGPAGTNAPPMSDEEHERARANPSTRH